MFSHLERRFSQGVYLFRMQGFFLMLCLLFTAPKAMAQSTILSASEIDYPPFCIVDEQGRAGGFSVELMRAALSTMGREVTFRTSPWAEVRGWLERSEVQALPLVGRTPERELLFDFTFPYMSLHGAIVVRQDTKDIQDLNDLRGRTVAVMKGDNAEEFMRREERGIEIRTTSTFEEALRELSMGRYDAVVIQRLVALRLIRESGLVNLKVINRPIEGFRQDFCFAVKEGDRDTLALLNEGLALVMADGTYRHLHAKWFAALELPMDKPIVIGGDHNYPPFEFLDDNGRPTGFTVELTRAIARETNMDVRIQLGRWEDMVNALRDGTIDALEGMFYSPKRDRVLDFSPRYLVIHCVSVVRRDEGPPPARIEELAGRDLVVQAEDAILDALAERGIEARITTVETQEDVVRAVAEGRNACGLGTRFGALYAIKKNGWTNIEIGDRAFYSGHYGYAVPKGNDALLAQFTEGLRVIKDSGEYQRIYDKWLGVYEEESLSLIKALRYSAMVVIPLSLLFLGFFLWSWSLRKQVARRTAELAAVSERQQAILTAVPDIIMEVDADKIYIWANPAGIDFFGEDVIGREASEFFVGEQDTYDTVKPLFDGHIAVFYVESWQRRKDGEKRLLAWWCRVLKDKKGKVTGALSTARDITEQKRDQLRIEHLNQVLRAIRDVNQLIVRERDREKLVREGCRLLVTNRGYSSALIVLTDDRDRPVYWAAAGLAEISSELAAMLEEGTLPPCCEYARVQKGLLLINDRNVVCGGCPVAESCAEGQSICAPLNHNGKFFGYLAVGAEIQLVLDEEERGLFSEMAEDFSYALNVMEVEAERRQGEVALLRSEKKYHDMLQNLMEGFYCATLDGKLLEHNREFVRILKLDPERNHAGIKLPDFWQNPDERQSYLDTLEKHGFVKSYEIKAKNANGEKIIVLANARVVKDRHGNPVHIEGSFLDITAQKRAEQEREKLQAQLVQAQKMESVGRLAGGVAHDYNNMLSVIMGNAELALGNTAPDDPLYENLKEILDAARRSTDITRQLLAFARKQTIRPEVLDLNETLEGMLKMLRRLIGEDIDLSWHPFSGLWPVNMDPSQLDQILANLLVNARDAIEGVGRVTIETDNVTFDAAYCADHAGFVPGDFVLLAVSDDGHGMDRDTLDNIFEPFFTTKAAGEGTGLGLSTVYGIVKQNDGFINAYSEPGKGTTFKIYLPCHTEQADVIKAQDLTEIPVSRGETVLIVEDETSILKLAKRFLGRLGYTVLEASTPGRAVDLAGEHKGEIHLLITDVVMPGMNGKDLAGKLQALYPALKVLFMSGYTANVIAHRGVLDEGVHFMQKPFSNRDLAVKVREALDETERTR